MVIRYFSFSRQHPSSFVTVFPSTTLYNRIRPDKHILSTPSLPIISNLTDISPSTSDTQSLAVSTDTSVQNLGEKSMGFDKELNLEATELRLGLPGTKKNNKRALPKDSPNVSDVQKSDQEIASPAKAQVVGWPPVRSYRKNCFQQAKKMEAETAGMYVKVSMDGAPYLRKIDLKVYNGYPELLKALEDMFKFSVGEYSEREGFNGSEFVPTYEDKDGDWMLVGDVPWDMFISSCKRLRIMKGSEARGLGCAV